MTGPLTLFVRLARGMNAAALVATAITTMRGLVVFPIVAKSLPIADYGLWAQLGVASTLLGFLAVAGLDVAALRFLAGARTPEKDRDFATATSVAVAGSGVVLLGCGVVGLVTVGSDTDAGRAIAALGVLVVGLVLERFALTQLRRLLLLWSYAGAVVALALGDVLAIGGALLLHAGLPGAILAWGTAKVAIGIALLFRSGLGPVLLLHPARASAVSLLRYGAPFIFISVLNWILNLSDRFLVGWFRGLEDVAYYSASYAVAGLVTFTFGPIFLLVQPLASGRWQDGQQERASRLLWTSLEWSVWLGIPSLVAIVVLAPDLLTIFTRHEYVAASLSAAIVAVALFVQLLSAFAETELGLLRPSTALMPRYAAAAIVNVASNLILIPLIGYLGAAISTLAAACVLALLSHWSVRGAPGWTIRLDRIAVAVVYGAVAGSLLALARGGPSAVAIAFAGAAAVGYGVLITYVMRPALREIVAEVDTGHPAGSVG